MTAEESGAGALLADLRAVVGDDHVLVDPALRAGFERDWTGRFGGEALAVVRPGDTGEVARVLATARAHRTRVVPQGGNTGLVGGGVPRAGPRPGVAIVLSTRRLVAPLEVDAEVGEAIVGAGVTLATLQRRARAAGWDVGVDFAARDGATIGGMIATNAGGVRVLRHGSMRRQVLGIEAALADGSVIRRTAGVRKDNTGYDLAALLAGSEGTLGVITAARLRLVPRYDRRAVVLLGLATVAGAVGVAGDLARDVPSLDACELFLADGLELVIANAGGERPFPARHPVYLLAEAAAAADPLDELVAVLANRAEVLDAAVASDPGNRARLWHLREAHAEAVNREGVPHKLDVAVPVGRLADFVAEVHERVSRILPEARGILYGHVLDGNLHVNVLGPPPDDERVDEAILELALELGGSISAEHGIGVAKVGWLERDRGVADVTAMRAIKDALDPAGVLNPGVLLPV